MPSPGPGRRAGGAVGELRALASLAVFFVRVFPMLPPQPVDWLTRAPSVEKISYRTRAGGAVSDVYRPGTAGKHPGVLVSLGVVPLGEEHPQVARMGIALARAGFAALVHWSPAMRDLRLDPADRGDLVSAYRALVGMPYVDPDRSGMLGTCVGGSAALLAAASPELRGRLSFVSAYAPYSSMWTLTPDIAAGARTLEDGCEPWPVDPITWQVYVRSLADCLEVREALRLRRVFEERIRWNASKTAIVWSPVETAGAAAYDGLSDDARAVARLLSATDRPSAEAALCLLPAGIRARLDALSPLDCAQDIDAPLIHLMHDRYDQVVPVGESRRLVRALAGRPGVHYTELGFRHLDPTRLSPLRLVRELPRFCAAMYPIFRQAMA